jgi:hypothetical protein
LAASKFRIFGSGDGIDGVGIKLFKLRANLPQLKICNFFSKLQESSKFLAGAQAHAKFAIRLFLEWRFAHFLCGAQEMSKCPKNEYRDDPEKWTPVSLAIYAERACAEISSKQ